MAISTVYTYELDGSKKDFSIPFEYLARRFVKVTLIGVNQKVLNLTTDYRFTSKTSIQTTLPWGPAEGYTLIEIRRETSATERLVDFSDGSILRSYEMNLSQVQTLHVAEEARNLISDTIGVNNEGQLDARARRIVNLADAINPGDAVNLRMNQQWAGSALHQADRAEAQANASAESARQSQASNVAAQEAADRAHVSRINAEGSQVIAEQARDKAKEWAEADGSHQVEPGKYSARAWAAVSQNAAAESQAFAANADQSKSLAESSAVRAVQDADRATAQADRATLEADKLGNFNPLMGTVLDVHGVDARFKGTHHIKQALYIQRQFSDDTQDFMSISNEPNGILYIRDRNGGIAATLTPEGHLTTVGATIAEGGSVYTKAQGNANAHYWFEGQYATRGVIYADPNNVIHIKPGPAGSDAVALSMYGNGNTEAHGLIVMPHCTINTNGDILADWLHGGALSLAFARLAPGTPIKTTPTVIWERAVDGGVSGDFGAPGSMITLREPLKAGDQFMFEMYGPSKIYSSSNFVPPVAETEQLSCTFGSTGAVYFSLPNGGINLRISHSEPGGQYGIRRVFLLKQTLA